MSPNSSFRVGIVGCGGIAHHHLRGYVAAGATVAMVFDASQTAAESFAGTAGASAARSLVEMADAGLNAVSICTPPGTHLACCEPFLRRGVAVLCEKPMEATSPAAARLAEIVEETGTPFSIGFCHRFHGPVIEVKMLLDRGVLGRPVLLRNVFSGWVPLLGNHRTDRRLSGGGALADNGAHAVDLFRFLVGEPTVVSAITDNLVQEASVEDYCTVHLRSTRPAAIGEITSSYSLVHGANQIELFGTEGAALITYGMKHMPECAYRPIGGDDWIPLPTSQHPQRFLTEIGQFVTSVRSRGASSTAATAQDGLRAVQLIEDAYRLAAAVRDPARTN